MPIDQPGQQYDGFYNEAGIELVDMWFEDSFGRKHKLKRVRKYLHTMNAGNSLTNETTEKASHTSSFSGSQKAAPAEGQRYLQGKCRIL